MTDISELVDQAILARDTAGAAGAAEKLLLFSRVANALQQLTQHDRKRKAASRKVRDLVRELSAELRRIEISAAHEGPDPDAVSAYYRVVRKLTEALQELDTSLQE